MKVQVLLSRVLEGNQDLSAVEEELTRLLGNVEGEIVSVQFEELQENGEYRIYLVTK